MHVQLKGDINELKGGGGFGLDPPLSVPVFKEALLKAAYDPRIRGIHLKVSSIGAGWAKLQVPSFLSSIALCTMSCLLTFGWPNTNSLLWMPCLSLQVFACVNPEL